MYPPLKLLPVGITSAPVLAPPSTPLPPLPVSLPGTPAPAYCAVPGIQPFNPLALSIPVPGAANQTPAIPELVMLRSKLATTFLRNAKVKYCVPVSPLLSGPAGKLVLWSVTSYFNVPKITLASLVPLTVVAPADVYGLFV